MDPSLSISITPPPTSLSFNKISTTFKEIDTRLQALAEVALKFPDSAEAKGFHQLQLHVTYLKQYYPSDPDLTQIPTLATEKVGLRAIDSTVFDAWVQTQPDALQPTLMKVKESISYVSKEKFQENFTLLIAQLQNHLEGHLHPIVLTNGAEKSTNWLIALAQENCGVNYESLSPFDHHVSASLKENMTFVILDDASYTGTQISLTIEKAYETWKQAELNSKPSFVIACVYMTTLAQNRIIEDAKKFGVTVKMISIEKMETIQELVKKEGSLLSQDDVDLLNTHWFPEDVSIKISINPEKMPKLHPAISKLQASTKTAKKEAPMDNSGIASSVLKASKGCTSRTLTYFEHKVPDYLSFPKNLAEATAFVEGKRLTLILDLEPHYHVVRTIKKIIFLMERLGFTKKELH